jgi:hypothetical protein
VTYTVQPVLNAIEEIVSSIHVIPARTPHDILRECFARGEIDKAELKDWRRVLGE